MTEEKKLGSAPWYENKRVAWGLLLGLLLVAFTLRVTNIENIPFSIFPDEAQNGIDAQQANATGQYKLFYESNNGREGLFINIQAMSIEMFGSTTFALKLPSIIFGTLTVLGIFLLAKELFGSYLAGLTGAYLTTFAYWAINFSRIGFRAIMVPLILTFAFYFLWRGLRTKKFVDFALAGFIYGLGLHTYIAFRVSPLVLIVLFICLLIARENFLKNFWKHTLVFALAMFVTSAPMLLDFFYLHPEHYASRTSEVSILNPEVNHGNLLPIVAKTFGLSLIKYNLVGDQNIRHNYPPYPLLNPITGVAFAVGLIYALVKFFHLLWARFKKNIRDEKFAHYGFLLAWFFVLLIPEFLANEGNPHALRAIGTLPVVILLSTISFLWLFKKINAFGHSFKLFLISFLIFAFAFIAIFDTVKYFVFFANSPAQHSGFQGNLKEVSNYLRTFPETAEKNIVTGSMERLTIKYLNPNLPNTAYFYPGQVENISPRSQTDFVIIFTNPDWDFINATRDRFPGIKFQEHKNKFGDIFYTLKY
ncbi:MAG: glycosyltransferase family 39 protein [Candidatus Moraniibacteriota bacterium]